MCGIAGWFSTAPLSELESQLRLKAMCDAIVHRGPDDDGYFITDQVALGMRRLSIVDLQGGHQPMTSEDGAIQLVFNGEIFNHTQLRASLQARGVRFRTSSDTEVVLRLYEERGLKAFDELNGMFAVAIFDARDHSLLLVRDRLGVKPLYYSWDGRQLIFASEIKAIIATLPMTPAVNPRAIWDYLTFRYVPAPHTIWNGISKLLPAHRLKISRGAPTPLIERWWALPRPLRTTADDATIVERFASLLQNAVDIRMRADVPVGILLSGGLDSSVIAAMAAPSHPRLSTFSVAFEGAGDIDERKWAHLVATQLQTDHHDIVIGKKEFTDFLPDFVYYTDEPLADLASIPLYYVCKLARENVKVVLSGEGSDEILGGYSFDVWAQRWDEAANADNLYQRALRAIGARSNSRFDRGLLDLRQAVQPLTMTAYMSSAAKRQLLLDQSDMQDSLDGTRARLRDFGDASPLSQALFTYCQDWLVEDLLMKADKMSMANSLELRTPFLDYRVVEMASRLPDHWRVGSESDGRYSTKRILRHAAAKLVPSDIISRHKMGFPVPVYEWLSDELKPLAHDCLCSQGTKLRSWFKADALAELVARGTAVNAANDDRHRLWNAMILELWFRRWKA
ncbi:asparagine synthase (glutamine-hydrolyzing) [Bradyrhizobium sediminis]|uniref:asparagine synthase (glutamine-hydrolyzing) n=1 Tax=Bradyrhizobium sediminis TaxID=2840469 RepID=A0A975RYA9_9BRAD|nr:asparagine synthase (glutamine-hydrolyzing) [Bradyrhizobium sediminis]QWG25092.1 asparagine synthase (glutamine-hydrolyzing) [Bradyrhizobium sediminis]